MELQEGTEFRWANKKEIQALKLGEIGKKKAEALKFGEVEKRKSMKAFKEACQ